jgi:hypothetical protein
LLNHKYTEVLEERNILSNKNNELQYEINATYQESKYSNDCLDDVINSNILT